MDKKIWDKLINEAKRVQNARTISPFIEAGQVGAAILTDKGNIYTGVCMDTACTLGVCAERNAIMNMITNGESVITKIVCIDSHGNVGSPCGACRELIMQLDKKSKDIEILINRKTYETITMEKLMPLWWGYDRFK